MKETPTETLRHEEEINADKNIKRENWFSLGFTASWLYANNADKFKIEEYSNNVVSHSWSFDNTYKFLGLAASIRLDDNLIIESKLEKDILEKTNIWQLSFGAKYRFRPVGQFSPFARGGLLIGRMDWDDAPGDFDTGLGIDAGMGLLYTKSKFQIGIETSYRRMKYNYNLPSGAEYEATEEYLDMSGFILSGFVNYLF